MRRDGPLFHESVLMSPFHPLTGSLSQKSDKKVCIRCGSVWPCGPKHAPGTSLHRLEEKNSITYYVKVKLLLLVEVNFMKLFSGMIR